MKITEISIKRATAPVVVFIVLTLLGLVTYSLLGYELLPKFTQPVVTITTVYPGAAPSEVKTSVSEKIEDVLSSMENVESISSTSLESVSIVTVELTTDANVDLALQEAQRKINGIISDLPDDAEQPSLSKFSIDDLPIISLASTASNLDPSAFFDLVDQRIVPELSRINGMAQVQLVGGEEREIKVNIDRVKLKAYNLSVLQIVQMIEISNLDFPTGKIETNEEQRTIRLSGKYQSLEEIRNLVIGTLPTGAQIRIKDIGEVEDGKSKIEKVTRYNLENAIGILLTKQTDANAVTVSELTRAKIKELEEIYSKEGLKFNIAQDQSEFTLEAADSVIHDLYIAVILVALVMFLFLHSVRNAIIVMIAVPISLIATFTAMYLAGFTLNLMTLLALSLVVGILVDDAIVVIENIYRHMEMGKNRIKASFDGVKEIGFTVTSITFVIVVVFLPLMLVESLISPILTNFSLVIVVATLLSLLVAFTIIPLLTSRFAKIEKFNPKGISARFNKKFESVIDAFGGWINRVLIQSMNNKTITLIVTGALLIGSFMLIGFGFIGGEFISQGDRGEFVIRIELSKNSSVEKTNQTARIAEKIIADLPEVVSTFTTVGQTSQGFGGTQAIPNEAEINVKMVPYNQRDISATVFSKRVKLLLQENIPGIIVFSSPTSILGTASEAPIQVIFAGPELDQLMKLANEIKDELSQVEGTTELELSIKAGTPEVKVDIDRDKMASLGLDLGTVGSTMQVAFSGNTDAAYKDGNYEYDINVKLNEFDRQNVRDVESLIFINRNNQPITLDQFAVVTDTVGPSRLERKDRINSVKLSSKIIGVPAGIIGQELQKIIDNKNLPAGVTYSFGGDLKRQSQSFGALGSAFLFSIILVYLILVALYDNYIYPLVILFSIPVAIVGALLALALAKQTLNIFSVLGIIVLIGLVAKNAILVVDFTIQAKESGSNTREALIEATKARLRPILMTTIALVFGVLPIALAGGAGAEWKNGLGWAIIGGLSSSMLLSLVVVPVVYLIADKLVEKLGLAEKKEKYARELETN
ncbi:MAG: efflux RND transporter permease subunit [Fulvivirga sp.]